MKTNALKGMKDILPAEQKLRDYVQGKILETYRASGFERISTPMLEDAENLDKSDGGDNLNLIFKVLKRGDKLDAALAENAGAGADALERLADKEMYREKENHYTETGLHRRVHIPQ